MSTIPDYRYTLDFNPSTDIGPSPPPQLQSLISTHPTLKIFTPSSPHFQSLKAIWNLEYASNEPLAQIRPTNPSEISTVINFCVANNLPLAVRSGGHDLWGRSLVHGSVTLDIRELNSIVLAKDKKSFTIGGGAQSGDVVKFLDSHGLVAACTLASVTGHVGWAFSGGFGPFVNAFGLGVDQIISAKVITADGVLREADNELLWGIKGAGGAFGVITEAKFKAYPLPKMLGGMLVFKFNEAEAIIEGLQRMCDEEGVPSCLNIGCHFSKRGGMPMLMVLFSWASVDFEEGRQWLEKVKGLGTVMMDMVSESMPLLRTCSRLFDSDAGDSSNDQKMVRDDSTHVPASILQLVSILLYQRALSSGSQDPPYRRYQSRRRHGVGDWKLSRYGGSNQATANVFLRPS
jgi:FAD binding domain